MTSHGSDDPLAPPNGAAPPAETNLDQGGAAALLDPPSLLLMAPAALLIILVLMLGLTLLIAFWRGSFKPDGLFMSMICEKADDQSRPSSSRFIMLFGSMALVIFFLSFAAWVLIRLGCPARACGDVTGVESAFDHVYEIWMFAVLLFFPYAINRFSNREGPPPSD